MKCRLIEPIGTKHTLSFHWYVGDDYHYTEFEITQEQHESFDLDELKKQYASITPKCMKCGIDYDHNSELKTSTSERKVWNTEDGMNNHPGDMFYAPWLHEGGCPFWDNCNDPKGHLIVVTPDNGYWDTDSRASNCTMKDDKTHRCWIKHGEPPLITVDKQGQTCQAGAGSIQMSTWHGFLRNGELVA